MTLSTRVTQRLGLTHPVLLAAMDKLADARLTEAVSAAGGLGILGGGYGEAEWLERELALLATAREARGTRFGVGFITWSMARQPRLFDMALEAKPEAIWLSFGDPAPFAERARAAGCEVICQVQTVEMARDAVAKGATFVIAQGSEAGGHGAARGTFALVPAVVDAVGDQVPVLAAGGVADGRSLAAALMLGAEGVVLGTRFYASLEAAGHPAAKRRLTEASGDDTARSIIFDISRRNIWPAPFTGRCVVNEHAKRWMGRELELTRHMEEEGPRYEAARAAGDFDIAALIAGEGLDLIHDVLPAAEIVRNMTGEAEALLARGQGYRRAG